MELFVCKVCGHIEFNAAPERCPVCGAPKSAFSLNPNILKKPSDPNKLTDGDKKHIPTFLVKHECGLVDKTCVDAHIKIGEIVHVMEEKHWIQWIDLYLSRNFLARYEMAPTGVNPVIGIHLKSPTGILTAIESCNVHGCWMAETEL